LFEELQQNSAVLEGMFSTMEEGASVFDSGLLLVAAAGQRTGDRQSFANCRPPRKHSRDQRQQLRHDPGHEHRALRHDERDDLLVG
jgi:hypothetical protein